MSVHLVEVYEQSQVCIIKTGAWES